jgi:hypothetical protein
MSRRKVFGMVVIVVIVALVLLWARSRLQSLFGQI